MSSVQRFRRVTSFQSGRGTAPAGQREGAGSSVACFSGGAWTERTHKLVRIHRRVFEQHVPLVAAKNREIRQHVDKLGQARLPLIHFIVAVFSIEISCSREGFAAAGDKIALSALHVRPDEIDGANAVLTRPGIQTPRRNLDGVFKFYPWKCSYVVFRSLSEPD